MKTTSAEHGRNMGRTCSALVVFIVIHGNLLSYCGLIDAKIRASDKNLPVQNTIRWRSDHRQMALRSVPTSHILEPLGQTEVSVDRQRETTHEICCLAAELVNQQKIVNC